MSELEPKKPYKQVIVVRKDLNMRKGKIAAQAAHASVAALFNEATLTDGRLIVPVDHHLREWLTGSFRKICVYVGSEEELVRLHELAESKGLRNALITDRGDTEFHGVPTKTCLAVGPGPDSLVDEVTGGLPLL